MGSSGSQAKMAALVGKAGEDAVATQLLLRGIVPSWPSADIGFDLIAPNGCRIQIESVFALPHLAWEYITNFGVAEWSLESTTKAVPDASISTKEN